MSKPSRDGMVNPPIAQGLLADEGEVLAVCCSTKSSTERRSLQGGQNRAAAVKFEVPVEGLFELWENLQIPAISQS